MSDRGLECRGCRYRPRTSGGTFYDTFEEKTRRGIDARAVFVNCCPRCGVRPAFPDRLQRFRNFGR